MDHDHYRYEPSPRRGRWALPDGARIAAFVVLCLEHWELDPPEGAWRDPRMVGEFGSFRPDYRSWSQREYGLRIGVFRVIEALREAGLRPCVAANAMAVERLPGLVARFNDWGCEWIGHGIAATRMMHGRMPPAEQHDHIERSLATIERVCGRRPRGWLSQDWGTTPDTFRLLARAGVGYTLDWPNDDRPFPLRTEPPLLAIPLSAEWDDVQCQWLRNLEPHDHARLAVAAFDRLDRESARDGNAVAFGLALHPWVSGMPSRIAALRGLLSTLAARPGVWWTTPGAIAEGADAGATGR